MIKFFRKIRQQLISENSFSKYLVYAFGEIVLVVIGILIALGLNNNNESNKAEAKVLLVFEELLEDLESDINSIKSAAVYYEQKDSLTGLVLRGDLTREDYYKSSEEFGSLTRFARRINIANNAYNKLVQMSDIIPEEFKEVMDALYILNKQGVYVEKMNERMSRNVNEIAKHRMYNYSWSIKFDKNDFVDYLYSDPRYKSDVEWLSHEGVFEHFQHAFYYMEQAMKCYKDVSNLLNKPIDYGVLGYYPKYSEMMVGNWETARAPGFVVTVYKENNELRHKNNADDVKGKFYVISTTKLISSDQTFYTLVRNGDEVTAAQNSGVVWTKKKDD